MTDYKVKFEVFEGPLDLLLYLIKKQEVDIYQVNLTQLALQFIEYLDVMRLMDLEIAGEFLVMAATLMYIKSRELLPKDQQVTPEGEEEEDDPRWELIRQLVEYKKFKDAAARLQLLELRQEQVYPRLPVKPEFEAEPAKTTASLFDLLGAVTAVLKRVQQREDLRDLFADRWTVSEKIEFILQALQERPSVKFLDLFAGVTTRAEVVVTFLALLELMRLKQVLAIQNEPFGEIEICRPTAPGAPALAGSEGPILDESSQPLPAEAGALRLDAEVAPECASGSTPATIDLPAAGAPPIPAEPLSTLNSQLSTSPPPPPGEPPWT